ncbi:hypothetical protein PAEPH01_1611 [Pancytospora epiphaga]|nr:hypothetical protein PAEPH01_1611 [Pancytospora epiphaga]
MYSLKIPNIHKNKCVVCNRSIVEDVEHLLIVCPAYQDLRDKHLAGIHILEWPPPPSGRRQFVHRLLPGDRIPAVLALLGELIPRRAAALESVKLSVLGT